MKAKPKRIGRPSSFTQEVADKLCVRMADGESLRTILREPGMPSLSMVFRWLEKNEAFREQYALARKVQAQLWVDEIIEISDDTSKDFTVDKNGNEVVNGEAIARSRLRVDTRKWIACKVLPKIYGDKIDHNHTGEIAQRFIIEIAPPAPDTATMIDATPANALPAE
jgi:hypothetical protein